MHRVFVTDRSGFLGSHLCDRLIEHSNDVLSKTNIKHLLQNRTFEVMRHDVCFPLYIEINRIFNLACPPPPIRYRHDPIQTTETSVHGAINTLPRFTATQRLTRRSKAVRGRVNPIGMSSYYDGALRLFFSTRNSRSKSRWCTFQYLRPRMHPNGGRVAGNFIVQALRGKPITIFGDGTQTRSFCYVDDMIDGILRLMDTPTEFTGPVNLANPSEFAMLGLAEKVIKIVSGKASLNFKALPQDDPKQRQPDIETSSRLEASRLYGRWSQSDRRLVSASCCVCDVAAYDRYTGL
ncbi:UDP-glucuronate decarboxylase [Bradyrhizobium sp. USDA 336]